MKKTANNAIKTSWDFKLFYQSEKDPQIEKDVLQAENAYATFAHKYKDKIDYTDDPDALYDALVDYEKLTKDATSKPILFWHYIKDTDSKNAFADAEYNKLIARYTKAANEIVFFTLKLGKIPKDKQKEFLRSTKLSHFTYFLKCIFDTAQYNLSEPEEKILNLMSQPANNMWTDAVEKYISKLTVKYKNRQIPLPEAFGLIPSLPTKERRKLHVATMTEVKRAADFAEAEINAIYTDKKIRDELRGLLEPYDATIIGYQNDPQIIKRLVDTVTQYFYISHRFYKLKARILKEKKLTYADRGAMVGNIKMRFDIDSSVMLTKKAFNDADPKFAEMFVDFFRNGQVDVYPKKGKRGGAYCSGSIYTPTVILLNHTNDFRSITTLAHEMGHAFHSELSRKNQSPLYADYTISVAEVASTLFENFVFDEIFERLSEKEKIIALHNQINDDVSTIFRQIACFNYEYALHKQIREKGSLTHKEMASLMNTHVQAYLGPVVKLDELDGYFFVDWMHIRNFFYVYSYAFGQIISKALYAEYKKDKNFIKKIEQFLSAGGSKSPEDIFKSIGIDVTTPGFFESGLKQIEEDIERLEKLIK